MRLSIRHVTTYRFEQPVIFALQQLRKTPRNSAGQRLLDWQVTIEGGSQQASYDDHHGNHVILASLDAGTMATTITSAGTIEVTDTAGIVGPHRAPAPLWLYQRETDLTQPGKGTRALIRGMPRAGAGDDLAVLHRLSAAIGDAVTYQVGETDSATSAEDAIAAGQGVCQDHSHVFLAAARALGYPARYVSGYLTIDDLTHHEAAHAWAEAHVEGLGWVGFDISNGISPDARYVRVACGLDYRDSAPVSGLRYGAGGESLEVALQVQQQ